LRTDYSEHALFFGKSGKFLCLSQAVAEGPLAVNVLARCGRRFYHIKMMRHAHSDADHIDIRRGDQIGDARERPGPMIQRGRRPYCAREGSVCDAGNYKIRGQSTQRWDMGFGRPATARLQADDANSKGL
jgi:hypothetical protein